MGGWRPVDDRAALVLATVVAGCLPAPPDEAATTDGTGMGTGDCGVWHPDEDGDDFGDPVVTLATCRPAPGWVLDASDCHDGNADARPDQAAYFAVERGDESFDYDCDGFSSPEFFEQGSCEVPPLCARDEGWSAGIADCGRTEAYLTDCGPPIDARGCVGTAQERLQRCR